MSGGVKTVYRQVECLNELGFEAYVFQPDGRATRLNSTANVLGTLLPSSDDILVFPENPTGWLAELAQTPLPATKVLFCQAQYYIFHSDIPIHRFSSLGFSKVVCPSAAAKGFLERVCHFRDVAIVPCYIDTDLFCPREKRMQIAFLPHKLPREVAMLQAMFMLKYPHFRHIRWLPIENLTEVETAELLGQSSIYLSLPYLESFGLVPLEAMASGCAVVGFHGYGGMEYASKDNGIWLRPDHLEEVVDALAGVIVGLDRDDAELRKMRDAGLATAKRYDKQRTKTALEKVYAPLIRT
jgi:glycosyltransferase involved in cell wall biosynthesis